ncbi:MAG: hypothetical protein ACYC64_17415 [Armatimonadota bacterium]
MRLMQLDEMRTQLDTAIVGVLCVQTWLGYAQVLFVGFGDEVLPYVPPGGRHTQPPYELQTEHADWQIEDDSGVIGTADDEYTKAEAAAQRLVGRRANRWQFIGASYALEIEFDGGLKLKIVPMADTEASVFHKNAWNLRMPDDYYRHTRWDGTMYALDKDEPCTHEPPEAAD